jgi:2,5-diamino-6-(ribosylamino)-4(3H)-pyrimidinone 5'-phosphate reductase
MRPFVSINMAMTADGKITSAARDEPRFTSSYDRRNMDRLRAEADALIVGAGTIRADNPPLHVRDPEMQAHRQSLGKADLIQIVVSSTLDLPDDCRIFDGRHGRARIVVTVEDAPAGRIAELARRVEIWQVGRGRVDLQALLQRLAERGVARVLVEGGGVLNWGFVEADLVDELHVTIAPTLLGGRDAPTLVEGPGLAMANQRRLKLLDLHREQDELYCRYAVVR